MKEDIAKRDQVTSALLGVFSSSETVDEFVSDNIGRISLKGFIDYTATNGIIASADEYDLTTLYVDFPMEKGISNPLSYQQSIKNVLR